jgi:periplasmic protein TonB
MALSATTYRPEENFKRPMTLSIAFHAALGTLMVVSTVYSHRGENWGGPGGAITVGLVGSVPGVPLPKPDVESASRVVDESKGLYKSEPQPKTPPPTDATPIPKFERNKPPKYVTRPSRTLENPTPPPSNAVPYGGGGAPTVPYTSFSMGSGTQGGMGFSGSGGGNFGSKFPWYVEAVQRRVSSNWLQTTVDPGISTAPRAVVTFDILRDGSVANIQVMRSSGNNSVDTSAVRAIRASSPLDRLPGEYSGSKVSVEFWFDFHR